MSKAFRRPAFAAVLLSATMLAGCATYKPPQISYDANVPPLPAVPAWPPVASPEAADPPVPPVAEPVGSTS